MAFPRTRTETIDCDCTPRRAHGQGTHVYYRHRCGCDPCRQAHLTASRERRARKYVTVPTGPIVEHIAALRAAGMPMTEIARISGWDRQSLYYVVREGARMDRDFAEDVLSIPVPEVAA